MSPAQVQHNLLKPLSQRVGIEQRRPHCGQDSGRVGEFYKAHVKQFFTLQGLWPAHSMQKKLCQCYCTLWAGPGHKWAVHLLETGTDALLAHHPKLGKCTGGHSSHVGIQGQKLDQQNSKASNLILQGHRYPTENRPSH